MSKYLNELVGTGSSLMIFRDGEAIFSSASHGIAPILEAIDRFGRGGLRGTIVSDKIVGKAAAHLILFIEASEAHATLISSGARNLFAKHGLKHFFVREVPVIMRPDGSGICLFERLVMDLDDPGEAYERIREKMSGH